jgi:hypothetical protein
MRYRVHYSVKVPKPVEIGLLLSIPHDIYQVWEWESHEAIMTVDELEALCVPGVVIGSIVSYTDETDLEVPDWRRRP